MTRYDGIIFDIDGTLWNAATSSAKGWNQAIEKQGFSSSPITAQDIESVSGKPFDDCVKSLFPEQMAGNYANLSRNLDNQERKIVEKDGGKLYQGVEQGIRTLSQQLGLFLISNCQDWYLNCFFKHSKLKSFFKDWDCHGNAGVPKAEMIKNMVGKHQLKNPIYIGDTLGDKESSDIAKVEFGYAAYGFGNLWSEDLSFNNFNELVNYFQQ